MLDIINHGDQKTKKIMRNGVDILAWSFAGIFLLSNLILFILWILGI